MTLDTIKELNDKYESAKASAYAAEARGDKQAHRAANEALWSALKEYTSAIKAYRQAK